MQQLRTLVSKLQELITLHRKYNCRLALSEFEKVKLQARERCLVFVGVQLCLDTASLTLSSPSLTQENTTTIVFRMFDRVSAPELIPSVLDKFVRVYMREHNLQEEELLLLYIEVMLSLICKDSFPFVWLCVLTDFWVSRTTWEA